MKVGILYIGIGNYTLLWEDFFKSAEKYLFPNVDKQYFLFTDKELSVSKFVSVYYQKDLGGYNNTLYRFKMFYEHKDDFDKCDYLFFFNGDTLFKRTIHLEELKPSAEDGFLVGLVWHIYRIKDRDSFPYDRNPDSMAYIPYGQGLYYFQGGFNGGRTFEYLQLIEACMRDVEIDSKKGVVAFVNDESHLNKYLLNKKVKIVGTEYGKPEKWFFPVNRKVIFRDKNDFFRTKGLNYDKKPDHTSALVAFLVDFNKYIRAVLKG